MSRFNERLFAKLDAAVEPTGIPAYARGKPRRRHLRWLPIPILLAATGAMATALLRPDLVVGAFTVMMAAFVPASILQIFGPVKAQGTAEKLDEFDLALRSRAYLVTYGLMGFGAMSILWLIILSSMEHPVSVDAMTGQLRVLAFFLMTLFLTVPTLHASWTTRPVEED